MHFLPASIIILCTIINFKIYFSGSIIVRHLIAKHTMWLNKVFLEVSPLIDGFNQMKIMTKINHK